MTLPADKLAEIFALHVATGKLRAIADPTPPRPIRLQPIPKPRAKTGLPLFDMETPDA